MIQGTEGFPPWMQIVGGLAFVVTMGVLAAFSQMRGRKDAEKKAKEDHQSAERQVGKIMAVQPSADRWTQDALVQTLASLKISVDRLIERMERQDREREDDEKAELRELRRIVKDIRGRE
jgi:hypothetical protein